MPPKDSGGASKRGCGSPLSCCGRAARSVICPGVGRVFTRLTQGASFRARLCHQPKVVYRPAWSRRWWASLSVRGERATTGLRRALSEAGEGTVLARPEAQLSGRARAVVLVANDEAKRPSGSQPRHLSMPSMNSTSRVRPVASRARMRCRCSWSFGGGGRHVQYGRRWLWWRRAGRIVLGIWLWALSSIHPGCPEVERGGRKMGSGR